MTQDDPLRRHMWIRMMPARGAYCAKLRWQKHRARYEWNGLRGVLAANRFDKDRRKWRT